MSLGCVSSYTYSWLLISGPQNFSPVLLQPCLARFSAHSSFSILPRVKFSKIQILACHFKTPMAPYNSDWRLSPLQCHSSPLQFSSSLPSTLDYWDFKDILQCRKPPWSFPIWAPSMWPAALCELPDHSTTISKYMSSHLTTHSLFSQPKLLHKDFTWNASPASSSKETAQEWSRKWKKTKTGIGQWRRGGYPRHWRGKN